MFTGIVTERGRVAAAAERPAGRRLVIESALDLSDAPLGASIACSGACLTIVEKTPGRFAVDVSAETLKCTTLGGWRVGTAVNLERPLRVGGELGGHLVLGHVDGVARLLARTPEGSALRLSFEAPAALARFIAPKGSVALDGVSLTVNEVADRRFAITVVPLTQAVTTLGELTPGAGANLEVDVLARYVARLKEAGNG